VDTSNNYTAKVLSIWEFDEWNENPQVDIVTRPQGTDAYIVYTADEKIFDRNASFELDDYNKNELEILSIQPVFPVPRYKAEEVGDNIVVTATLDEDFTEYVVPETPVRCILFDKDGNSLKTVTQTLTFAADTTYDKSASVTFENLPDDWRSARILFMATAAADTKKEDDESITLGSLTVVRKTTQTTPIYVPHVTINCMGEVFMATIFGADDGPLDALITTTYAISKNGEIPSESAYAAVTSGNMIMVSKKQLAGASAPRLFVKCQKEGEAACVLSKKFPCFAACADEVSDCCEMPSCFVPACQPMPCCQVCHPTTYTSWVPAPQCLPVQRRTKKVVFSRICHPSERHSVHPSSLG
jgi:hypothetical protein